MNAFEKVASTVNFFREMKGVDLIPENPAMITNKQAREMYEHIASALSPENLMLDGEITVAQARQRADELMEVVQTLVDAGHPIPLDMSEIS